MKSILTLLIFVILGVASCKEKGKPLKKYKMTYGKEQHTIFADNDTTAFGQAIGIFTLKSNAGDTTKSFILKDSAGREIDMISQVVIDKRN